MLVYSLWNIWGRFLEFMKVPRPFAVAFMVRHWSQDSSAFTTRVLNPSRPG